MDAKIVRRKINYDVYKSPDLVYCRARQNWRVFFFTFKKERFITTHNSLFQAPRQWGKRIGKSCAKTADFRSFAFPLLGRHFSLVCTEREPAAQAKHTADNEVSALASQRSEVDFLWKCIDWARISVHCLY